MFKVGDKVTCARWVGIGEVTNVYPDSATVYQVIVNVPGDSRHFSFTLDGRYCLGDPITLFPYKEEPTMNKITVTIELPKSFEITQAEHDLIHALADRKVLAIRFIKVQYDLRLIEAKKLCDKLWGI